MTNQGRQKILSDIADERVRQLEMPGSEYDARHSHNDWIAIAGRYLTEPATRKRQPADLDHYRNSLIKAAAVIVAALEHLEYPS